MALDQDLKVIIDYLIKDAKDASKTSVLITVPDDYKEVLFGNKTDAVTYIESLGYTVSTNDPDEKSWRGWDVPLFRANEFPDGFAIGRDHNNYQLMHSSITNLQIKVTF